MYGVKGALSYFKQLPLNSNQILGLFIDTSFGEGLLFHVKGGENFSFDNPLDYHSEIMSGRSKNVVIVF